MSLASSSARRTGRSFAPALCSLEDRRLLTGSINYSGGTLAFLGGSGASHAELNVSPTNPQILVATIDGQRQEFLASEVKVVFFRTSMDGQDSFKNNTNETSVNFLFGAGNSFVGGTGSDFVVDYSGTADIHDDSVTYIDASHGGSHGVSIKSTQNGGLTITAR